MDGYSFIIFGVTGDLSKKKILPALYQIIKNKKIDNYIIVGTALEQTDIEEIINHLKKNIADFEESVWQNFIARFTFFQLDIKKSRNYEKLLEHLVKEEKKYNLSGNRLVYCSVPSTLYIDVTKNLVKNNIIHLQKENEKNDYWNRIVYEKPFGQDYKSAKKINRKILSLLDESQIFRVDHYLAKEIVENITFVRFTNEIFEPLWNSKHIASVQIILDEEIGLESRGKYYDNFGALKDVVQNHMLQLLALVAMEPPKELLGDFIRDSKLKILKKVKPISGILGQYIGYDQEEGIKEGSNTETFAAIKLLINHKRWENVPFFFRTGKFLDKKSTKIVIKFKHAYCLLSQSCPIEPDYLTISIYPKEGIIIDLYTKKPDERNKIMKAKMEFCYDCLYLPGATQAYESIMMDIIKGEKSISVRFDEIEFSWKIIDQIKKMNFPLYKYKKGTTGPAEVLDFEKN